MASCAVSQRAVSNADDSDNARCPQARPSMLATLVRAVTVRQPMSTRVVDSAN
jgi:hypothetical protein